jgi:hypothetical protein
MNSKFVVSQAEEFARRIRATAGDDVKSQLVLAWQLALSRAPSEGELASASAFVAALAEELRARPVVNAKSPPPDPAFTALASFCQALLAATGFVIERMLTPRSRNDRSR